MLNGRPTRDLLPDLFPLFSPLSPNLLSALRYTLLALLLLPFSPSYRDPPHTKFMNAEDEPQE